MVGQARVTGYAESPVGRLEGTSTDDLASAMVIEATRSAGLGLGQLDGLVVCSPLVGGRPRQSLALAESLGTAASLRYFDTVSLSGASALAGVLDAFALVESGTCSAVAVVAADTPRTGQRRSESVSAFAAMRHPSWEQPLGMMNVSAYALLASSYLSRHKLSPDALCVLPVLMRQHAHRTPGAAYRNPLTADDVARSRVVSSPLRLLECAPVSDGAGAVVVTGGRLGRAGACEVALRSGARAAHYDNVSFAGDMTTTGCVAAGRAALDDSGVALDSIDVALLYDSYSITLAIELEELGFCPPGTAARWVAEGGGGMSSPAPVNPHGGLLSHAHCGGAAGMHHVVEAIKQLSGRADNQVRGARRALLHAEGGILSAHCTAVLDG